MRTTEKKMDEKLQVSKTTRVLLNPGICRMCGKDRAIKKEPKKLTPIRKEAHSYQIQVLTGVNVHEDHAGCPPYICLPCRSRLKREMKLRHIGRNRTCDITEFNDPTKGEPASANNRSEHGDQSQQNNEDMVHTALTEATPDKHNLTINSGSYNDLSKLNVLTLARAVAKQSGFIECSTDTDAIFVQLDAGYVTFRISISVADLTWKATYREKLINKNSEVLHNISASVLTEKSVEKLFETFSNCRVCKGHSQFPKIANDCLRRNRNLLYSRDRQTVIAYVHENVIRNVKCDFLLTGNTRNNLCQQCSASTFQAKLRARESKFKLPEEKSNVSIPLTSAKSKCNFVHLTGSEVLLRMKELSKKVKLKRQKIKSMHKYQQMIESESIPVSEQQHALLRAEIENEIESKDMWKIWPASAPQRLFWEQQQKLFKLKGPQGMRWHPMLIRWAVSIFMKSPEVYRNLNKSGFIQLPHESTIKTYLKFTDSQPDVNPDVLKIVVERFKLGNCPEFHKNVGLVWDEMKIKSGLVVTKGTGNLVGFVQSDLFSSALHDFSNFENGTASIKPQLATHIIVFMVRGLLCNVNLPFIWYPCSGFNANELYGSVWTATQTLEDLGLKVRAWICDGAASNRKFFNLHKTSESDGLHFSTQNHYASDRVIYFICDAPHLLKTTRNNLENSHGNLNSKNLVKNKKSISWNHIVSTVEEDMSRSLCKLSKLKNEHIRLSPQLRMRVKLASQILSNSVSNAILLRGDSDLNETAKFCKMFDKWFDCLNVRYVDEGIQKRKPDLLPYRRVDDPRFAWLQETFLGWLEEWDFEIQQIPGLSKSERRRLLLSSQTSEGLKITTTSFIHLTKNLLQEDGVQYFLPEKLNQDRLEVFFGKLRRSVGDSDNPSVEEARHRIVALLAAGKLALPPRNTNSVVLDEDDNDDTCYLPKKKKSRKTDKM